MGNELLAFYNKKVSRESKIAFWFTFILGILIHIFKFTNNLPNPDSLDEVYASQNVIGSGRWLLSLACGISSYFNLPWITGLFSIFFLSLAVVFIVAVFSIKNPFIIALTCGLLVSFPGTTETFYYQYTADGYMIAMLLASVSVWLTRIEPNKVTPPKKFRNFAISCLCICCTCAIYQTYVSFALILALCYFLYELLKNRFTLKEKLTWLAAQAVTYVTALLLFYIIWKVLLRLQGGQVNNYLGIDSMGIDLDNLLHSLPNSYRIVLTNLVGWNIHDHGFHLRDIAHNNYELTVYAVLNILFMISFAVAVLFSIYKSQLYKRKLELFLFLGALFLVPPICCIWLFTSGTLIFRYSTMMLHALCILYIFAAVLYEEYFGPKVKNTIALLLVTIVLNNILLANIAYYYFNRMYYASLTTSTEIVCRIDMLGSDSNQLAFIGTPQDDDGVLNEHTPKLAPLNFTPINNLGYSTGFINETFCREYSHVDKSWLTEDRKEIMEEMGTWPSMDSLKVIDGVIVIKFS